jgi:hypothetical protein
MQFCGNNADMVGEECIIEQHSRPVAPALEVRNMSRRPFVDPTCRMVTVYETPDDQYVDAHALIIRKADSLTDASAVMRKTQRRRR